MWLKCCEVQKKIKIRKSVSKYNKPFYSVCRYKGDKLKIGQSVPAGDNCNTCNCQASGSVTCTDKTCCKCAVSHYLIEIILILRH